MTNKKLFKIATLLIMLVMTAAVLSSCGSSNKLVGRWENAHKEIEFFSDGTYSSDDPNGSGSYSIDNNRLKLERLLEPARTYKYEVSGNTLKLYNNAGEVMYEYQKAKN